MAAIPKGSFNLTDKGVVTTGAFCLDVTEVTVEAYAACVKSGGCRAEKARTQFWPTEREGACNWGVAGRENHPMNCVDFEMAASFCQARGGRLPTEEEWEWAARGGDEGRRFPWGNAEPGLQVCWSGVSERTGTCPVGSSRDGVGRFGQLDLAGNVWEWTASLFPTDPPSVPVGRVGRGGAWKFSAAGWLSTAYRDWLDPSWRKDDLGFRCAQ